MTKKRKSKSRLALRYAGDDGTRSGDAPPSPVSPDSVTGSTPSSPSLGNRVFKGNQISSNRLPSSSDFGQAPLSDLVEEINLLSCFEPISRVNSSYAQALLRVAPPTEVALSSSAEGPCLLGLHSLADFPSLSTNPGSSCSTMPISISVGITWRCRRRDKDIYRISNINAFTNRLTT